MKSAARGTRWIVLIVGIFGAIGIAIFTGIEGCGNSDKFGRVSIPGEGAFDLDEGKYTLYYQEHINLADNASLSAPNGIRITARGLEGAPAPELDLGGIPSSISVNDEHSVSIGKLKIPQTGRYSLIVGDNPRPADRPAITIGETFGKTAARGGKRIGLVLAAAIGLFVLLGLIAGRKPPASVPVPAGSTDPFASVASTPAPPPTTVPPMSIPAPYGISLPSSVGDLDHDARLTALERLADLRDQGAISQAELDRLKQQILA